MYLTHFRLQRHPFSMTPDPAFLYLTNGHREALAALTYAILGRKGFVVLTGEAGTGKTTLIAKVIQSIPSTRVLSSVVLNPTLTPGEFLETILMNLGIAEVPQSKAQRLQFLQGVLLEADKNGKVPVLIVDEAHKVTAGCIGGDPPPQQLRKAGEQADPDRPRWAERIAGHPKP